MTAADLITELQKLPLHEEVYATFYGNQDEDPLEFEVVKVNSVPPEIVVE